MLWEFPIPFIAPNFYEIDLSEIPILVGSFIMGPVSGIIMEAIKIVLKILLKGTTTGYVGELANFCIGCCLVVPAGIIYKFKKSKKGAFIGIVVGIVLMAVAGAILNYYVMLPFYEKFMPLEAIIEEGAKVNPIIKDKWSFVWVAVAPFNVFKAKEKKVQNTVERINLSLRTYTGGYQRFENDNYMNGNPWPIANLWMTLYYLETGEKKKAKECFDFVVKTAGKYYFLGEQVNNETLKPNWVIGLGWSHAMFIIVLEKLYGKEN